MTGATTVAVVTAARLDAGVQEFVRLCVGLVAGGGALELVEAGAGAGVLSAATDLPDEVERSLEALAELGIVPRALSADEVRVALRRGDHLLRVADPGRPGAPELLVLDDALLATISPADLLDALTAAGQVIRI